MPAGPVLVGWHNHWLVLLSIAIAIFGGYAALNLAERIPDQNRARIVRRLTGVTLTMALTIWSMHYTGMLAFHLVVPIRYDWPTVVLTLVLAAIGSAVAGAVAVYSAARNRNMLLAAVFQGAGIVGLHYTAMASMRVQAETEYSPILVGLSAVIAVAFSWLAYAMAFHRTPARSSPAGRRMTRALSMGAGISGMHYTGMTAVTFIRTDVMPDLSNATTIPPLGTAAIVIGSGMALSIALLTSVLDRLYSREQELEQSSAQLRALAARLQGAREDERKAVAREIHDELGQALTSIKIDLAALVRDVRPGPEPGRTDSMLKRLDDTIQSVRRLATQLRPSILDHLGLAAAIEWAAADFAERTGVTCEVRVADAELPTSPEQVTGLFRIFQETLTNISRHAQATRVEVHLYSDGGALYLRVEDNGQGMEQNRRFQTGSLGIIGMRERAFLLGGDLTIRSARGAGTIVEVRIPLVRSDS